MRYLNASVLILLIVGAINWGLVGLFEIDLVTGIFNGELDRENGNAASAIVYTLVGLAGLYGVYLLRPVLMGARDSHRGTVGERSPGH